MRISRPLASTALILALGGIGCPWRAPAPQAPAPAAPAPAPLRPPAPANINTNVPAPAEESPTSTQPPPAPTATTTPEAPPPEPPPPTSSVRTLTTTVTIDETWQSYTNASLDFQFRWPSRGRYAPEWEVRLLSESDSRIADGCYSEGASSARPSERVAAGGVEFCRSSFTEGAAGTRMFLDHYVTKKGKTNIVISFTKTAYSGDALGCSFDLSAVSTTCVKFEEAELYSLLDQIISTFRYTE